MTLPISRDDREYQSYTESIQTIGKTAIEVVSVARSLDPNGSFVTNKNGGFLSEFSTNTPLLNGQSFDSGIVDLQDYTCLTTQLYSDVSCSLVGTWYDDASGTNIIRTFTLPYDAASLDLLLNSTVVFGRYLRYVVTNNSGTNQAVFWLRVKVDNTSKSGQILELNQFIPLNVLSQLTRSVIAGRKPDGNFQNVNLSRQGTLLVDVNNIARTSFDELKTASRYAQIELKSAVDQVSLLRNYVNATNASVSVNASGEYRVFTDATLGARVAFESGERGRYIAGYEAEAGVGVRLPVQTFEGTQKIEWGYFDDDNGLGYGVDATGVYIFSKRQGVQTNVYQSDWNKDKLDGSGGSENPSGLTLDLSEGVVTQIEFVWYGYGAVEWYINMKNMALNRGSEPVLIHTKLPSGETSISQPNLPISVIVDNGNQSTSREIYVGGRQFSIYGQPSERFRVNGERRENVALVNTAWRPIISLRRKTGIGNNQSVELTGLNIIPNNTIAYTFVLDGTLTGATFGNLSDVAVTETVLESDIAATAITGGTFFGGVHLATGNNQSQILAELENLNFDFVNSKAVTLVARSIGATATVTVAALNVREQW